MTPSDPTVWLFLVLVAPAAGAVLALIPLPRVSEWSARLAALVTLAAALALLAIAPSEQWGSYLGIDQLSEVFLVMVAGIYTTSTWYSRRYLRAVSHPYLGVSTYYALLAAFAFAMVATLVVSDLGLMWIGLEATTIASALLVVLERKPTSVEAAWRYTIIASAGLTIALFALILLYGATGTLNIFRLAENPPALSLPIQMAIALALVGYGTKVGLFPMHTWLPDAHSEAPSPVSAMFSGVLLPTALYAFVRVYRILPSPPVALSDLVLGFGVATALVAAFLLQRQRSFKRLLAYSSMEVMGLAVIGIAIGGVALYGALILLVAHAFAKSAAFYCAGNVLQETGTTRIEDVRNLGSRAPWTGAAWVLAAFGVTGAPPFGTFLGELLIVTGALATGNVLLAAAIVTAIAVAFLGVNSQIGRMVFGGGSFENPSSTGHRLSERGISVAYLNVGIALALGVVSLPYLTEAIRAAATLLGGSVP